MFLQIEDLGGAIYGYQVDQITEGNDDLVVQALLAAEVDARSYFTPNLNRKDSGDGRMLYDVDAIFTASGLDRNALIVKHTATLAKWHLIELCNAEIIYESAKERYDRAVDWFTKLARGTVNVSSLPQLDLTEDTREPFASGSNPKFNHQY